MFHTMLEWLKEHAVRVGISYPTMFGIEYILVLCRYGLETVTQLFADGCLGHSHIRIEDYPDYRHRGFMLDTG